MAEEFGWEGQGRTRRQGRKAMGLVNFKKEKEQNKTIAEKHITPHSLRHSIATHLLQQNVKLESIKTFLGHSSLESTQLYTHLLKTIENEGL